MQRFLLVVCLVMLTACSGPFIFSPAVPTPTITSSSFARSSPTKSALGFGAPTVLVNSSLAFPLSTPTDQVLSAPSYTLRAILDYASHSLKVDETIVYQNATGLTLNSIVMAVESDLWVGCFQLGSFTLDGKNAQGLILNNDQLDVPLVEPLIPGKNLKITLHYSLNLPSADSRHVFGYNYYQVNLVDWYPFIVPYYNGWLMHPPANVGEHLVYDNASFDVIVSLTKQVSSLIIAASAPAERTNGIWHYYLQNARTFVFSASPNYQSAVTTTNGMTITSFFFADDKTQGLAVLSEVSKAVTTFIALFGAISYPSLNIVESPFYDGLEYDGLFFLSRDFYKEDDGTVLNNLVDIAVHETAHQWWFGSVGNDQALEPWLDEAMATYSERLFYEKNYPGVTAWWAFRVDAYNPSGWVDMDIYHGDNFRIYANAVYLRGAQFLEALRVRVGDYAFFTFLKDYSTQMAGKRANSNDFFRIFRLHTKINISDLVSIYFQRQH